MKRFFTALQTARHHPPADCTLQSAQNPNAPDVRVVTVAQLERWLNDMHCDIAADRVNDDLYHHMRDNKQGGEFRRVRLVPKGVYKK